MSGMRAVLAGVTRRKAFAVAAFACLLPAGCAVFEPNIRATRVGWHHVTWTGMDLAEITSSGEAFDFEFVVGTDTEPEMGPLFMGFAYSYGRVDSSRWPGATREHRAGIRFRSSVLDRVTATYPYAAVGAFLGQMDSEGERAAWEGFGLEGGYGVRIGRGPATLDLEMIFSWGIYESWYHSMSTRFGGALGFTF